MPVEFEKRTTMGVEEELKCGAELSEEASEVGVNLPFIRMPLAWAGRESQHTQVVLDLAQRTWSKARWGVEGSLECLHQAGSGVIRLLVGG